jgi:hypothetical protein
LLQHLSSLLLPLLLLLLLLLQLQALAARNEKLYQASIHCNTTLLLA